MCFSYRGIAYIDNYSAFSDLDLVKELENGFEEWDCDENDNCTECCRESEEDTVEGISFYLNIDKDTRVRVWKCNCCDRITITTLKNR